MRVPALLVLEAFHLKHRLHRLLPPAGVRTVRELAQDLGNGLSEETVPIL